MEAILIPAIVLGLTGLAMGLFLAYASIKFEVKVDPKIAAINEILPGANCGGCGYPGCAGYASAIVEENASMTLCAPGGSAVAEKIGGIMGANVQASDEKMVARVICQGTSENTTKLYNFEGELTSCAAVMLYAGGDKSCRYACLGYGDCVRVCPVSAITVKDTVANVDETACISCEMCVKTCPKDVIQMLPDFSAVTVTCSSKDKGAIARKACKTACIACGMCVKVCPVQAITIENNLARINQEICISCGKCATVCPTKAIVNHIPDKGPQLKAHRAKMAAKRRAEMQAKKEAEAKAKAEEEAKAKTETKVEVKSEVKTETKVEVKPEVKAETKTETKVEVPQETK